MWASWFWCPNAMSDYPPAQSILNRVHPPIYLAVCMACVWLMSRAFPAGNVLPDWLRVLGYFEIFLGLLLVADVAIRFFRMRTPVHPFHTAKELVTDGMLRFSRNPIYLGLVLIVVGYAMLRGTLPGLIMAPILMWALTEFVIKDEEAMLEREFGQAYRDYKARVRRWL